MKAFFPGPVRPAAKDHSRAATTAQRIRYLLDERERARGEVRAAALRFNPPPSPPDAEFEVDMPWGRMSVLNDDPEVFRDALAELPPRSARAQRLRRALQGIKDHQAAVTAEHRRSGLTAAQSRERATQEALMGAAADAIELEPVCLAEVAVQAAALLAIRGSDGGEGYWAVDRAPAVIRALISAV